ncbi:effector-associated constant component EACC1 [Actinocrispum wychmicini]|uniref:effector-associated constant component EACC1 n=1 Tax=Actinocrispum wychmicini TaxID=1213861 RepID=UPI0014055599|nr:hypothetical protein [Actinocrispum wychmicini]
MDDDGAIEVRVEPASSVYDPNDAGWRKQAGGLSTSLAAANIGPVTKAGTAAEGSKGTLDTLIIALGSSGAITAAVEIFRSWLGRDRSRRLTLTIEAGDGEPTRISLDGTSTSDKAMETVLLAALEQTRGNG